MATEQRAASNVVRHDNHTAPDTIAERTFTKPANFLIVYNSHATTAAAISFDGTNTFPIPAGGSLSMDLSLQRTYWTQSTGAACALKVMYGSEQ